MPNFYSRAINDLISAHELIDEVRKIIVYGTDNKKAKERAIRIEFLTSVSVKRIKI